MKYKIFTSFPATGWPILALPVFVLWVGIACNNVATSLNGNQMPVDNPICQSADADTVSADHIHSCATATARARFLIDRIPTDSGVLSLGDEIQTEALALQGPCWLLWGLYALGSVIQKLKSKSNA